MIISLFLFPSYKSKTNISYSIIQRTSNIEDNSVSINNIQVPIISLDVAVKNSYAYLVGENHFSYYRLDTSKPERVGYVEETDDYYNRSFLALNQIEIQGNYMYLLGSRSHYSSANATLFVAELYDANNFEVLGNCSFNASNVGALAAYIHELYIEDDYAFIGTTWYNTTYEDIAISLISILDISNKSNPVVLGNYNDTGICRGFAMENDTLFLALSEQAVYDAPNFSYTYIGENRLVILDVSNKSQPLKIHQLNLSHSPCSAAIHNGYLYLSYSNSSFEIYNIDDIQNPNLLISSNINSRNIVFENDLTYILEKNKLLIVDTEDIYNFRIIGQKKVRYRGENGIFHDCIIENNLVFAVRQVQYYGSFIIFDCTNERNPKIIFPDADASDVLHELTLTISGYVISPIIFVSIIFFVTRLLIKRNKKREVKNENGD